MRARSLQAEIGGEIVFFCHDSDHDPRETQTILHHRTTGEEATLNFTFANRIQRKWSPLSAKHIPSDWQARTTRQLGAYVATAQLEIFRQVRAETVADFCLGMYEGLGLLAGIRLVRSSDSAVRRSACDVSDFFVDVTYEGEVVRARHQADGTLSLHEGGDRYVTLPAAEFSKEQVSPSRDSRLRWMQSVIHCTHYIAGAGEQAYLNKAEAPEITFVSRDPIERSNEAWTESCAS